MRYLSLTFSLLIGFNLFVWGSVFSAFPDRGLNLYFLDVGQGDAALARLPGLSGRGRADILIDGGPGRQGLESLGEVLPETDRYIDLVMLSHPQLDHFGGLIDVLKRYQVGAFIYNGRDGTASAWNDLKTVLVERNIKTIILKEGDSITYGGNRLDILSPSPNFLKSDELNDTTLVVKLSSESSRALFTGDIGFNVEEYLARKYDVDADVLKVGHHGSKFSSGSLFLKEATPLASLISSGAKNTYGHPAPAAMGRLSSSG